MRDAGCWRKRDIRTGAFILPRSAPAVTTMMKEDMEELDRFEEYEDLDAEDREMLRNMHLNFGRGAGNPRRWEDLPERDKEAIRDLYRKATRGVTDRG